MFGRQLNKAEFTNRGIPGIGFMITYDENYNMENKQLCNVAEAQDQSDAVDLVQHMNQGEIKTLYNVVASLQTM